MHTSTIQFGAVWQTRNRDEAKALVDERKKQGFHPDAMSIIDGGDLKDLKLSQGSECYVVVNRSANSTQAKLAKEVRSLVDNMWQHADMATWLVDHYGNDYGNHLSEKEKDSLKGLYSERLFSKPMRQLQDGLATLKKDVKVYRP